MSRSLRWEMISNPSIKRKTKATGFGISDKKVSILKDYSKRNGNVRVSY